MLPVIDSGMSNFGAPRGLSGEVATTTLPANRSPTVVDRCRHPDINGAAMSSTTVSRKADARGGLGRVIGGRTLIIVPDAGVIAAIGADRVYRRGAGPSCGRSPPVRRYARWPR